MFGSYYVKSPQGQTEHLFIDEMQSGSWGTPEEVPGLSSAEGAGGETGDVACIEPGECVAYGEFVDANVEPSAFVLDEVGGVWGSPQLLSPVHVTDFQGSEVWRVVCRAVGACAAVGDYLQDGSQHPFVADEVDGTWGPETVVNGVSGLHSRSYDSVLLNVQCPAVGDCLASGSTANNANGFRDSFIVQEQDGTWLPATRIPWLSRRDTLGFDQVTALACPKAGWCTIGGFYQARDHTAHYFVQSQRGGSWTTPIALSVPGFTPKNADPVLRVECPQPERCDVAGYYDPRDDRSNDFVLSVVDGVASAIRILPNPAVRGSRVGLIGPAYLSCIAFDACGLAASFIQPDGLTRVAVSNHLGSLWTPFAQVPPFAALEPGTSIGVVSAQCMSARYCTAVGTSPQGVFVTH